MKCNLEHVVGYIALHALVYFRALSGKHTCIPQYNLCMNF